MMSRRERLGAERRRREVGSVVSTVATTLDA
jgi:hypothetical protein